MKMNPVTTRSFDTGLLARVEDAGLNASAPPQQRWVDGWLLRFSPGKAKRARCINPVATGRRPVPDKLAACQAVFDAAGLPLIVRITPFAQPAGLDTQLESLGLCRFDDTRVMVLEALDDIVPPSLPDTMELQQVGLEAFCQRIGALRGSPLAQRQAHAQRLAQSPVPFSAFELKVDGEVLACGQFALEDDLVGVYDVFTAEPARGRGLASMLCAGLLARARELGARHAYLQVDRDNRPARTVYHRLGFADGYAYHYRTRDPDAA
ncbi:GNAT family N-acetyltransferase [Piscinibacter defluvii]|uniref:GNAT family N-acetyltransferase n=1 Tax=Piscinibacter defluvii TaxID=1796922 RepID=UPI000FDF2915|nr:GNAT family N-acetyltransferase [Piscinibacter defluvii]